MDRRSFLVSAGVVLAGATVVGVEPAAATENKNGTGPVVQWEVDSGSELPEGYLGIGVDTLRAPRLVAYPGGLTIADAAHWLRLDRENLGDLRRHMVTVLADPASTRLRPGASMIADAPTTGFAVRAAGGKL